MSHRAGTDATVSGAEARFSGSAAPAPSAIQNIISPKGAYCNSYESQVNAVPYSGGK
jgi:hypothetical protein